jgi:hypothetical protein
VLNKAMRQFPFAVSLFPYLNIKVAAPTVHPNKNVELKKTFSISSNILDLRANQKQQ